MPAIIVPHLPIIVALDFLDEKDVFTLVDKLTPELCALKIGKTLFTKYGPALVKKLVEKNYAVFLDLKFHDIPQQVAGACRAVAELGVWMLSVHTSGGISMLKAAMEAVAEGDKNNRPLIIGVTLLTSLDEKDFFDLGIQGTVNDMVLRCATIAEKAGLDGVVCSAQEVKMLRQYFHDKLLYVTPGIRGLDEKIDDQRRVTSPQQAIENGANYLVIGRPITQSNNPLQVIYTLQKQLSFNLSK